MSDKSASGISSIMRRLSSYIASALRRPLPPQWSKRPSTTCSTRSRRWYPARALLPGQEGDLATCKTLGGSREASRHRQPHRHHGRQRRAGERHARARRRDRRLARAVADAPGLRHRAGGARDGRARAANGTALLRAVALGYDVGCRLTLSLDAYQFREDGHSTHSFGPMFGAAAAAGALAGLREHQVRHLLSYTAQQASGISCWMRDDEHIEKAFDFGGMPARNGVAAATMVGARLHRGRGRVFGRAQFLRRLRPRPETRNVLIRGLGTTYEIMNTNIKRWSVGSPIQAPLDSLLDLIREQRIKADDVEKLVVRVAHQGANTVNNRDMPDICMQHMCAVMLLDGTVTFKSSHDEKRMRDRKVLALRSRIELTATTR